MNSFFAVVFVVLLNNICFELTAKNSTISDSTRYLSIGITPYNLLSRSSGVYVSYCWKNKVVEYRPSYTIPMPHLYNLSETHDWFYFLGINNNIFFQSRTIFGNSCAFFGGFKYWFFNDQKILSNDYQSTSSFSYYELKSGVLKGITVGVEILKDFTKSSFEKIGYINFSATGYESKVTAYRYYRSTEVWYDTPHVEFKDDIHINISIGFKFGYRRSLLTK